MYKIDEKSFIIICEGKAEAFKILLELAGYTKKDFCEYMEIKEDDINDDIVPQWAINYLKDLINADLIHLGYIIKDNKILGLMGDYNEVDTKIKTLTNESQITGTQPIVIKSSIVTEDGAFKIKYLTNAEKILKDFISNQIK